VREREEGDQGKIASGSSPPCVHRLEDKRNKRER
jgi:hypothetical protein